VRKPRTASCNNEESDAVPPILEIMNLNKVFQGNGASHCVLAGITFSARRGELICLLGRSGCGKSTLLKILAGFMSPTSGEAWVEGQRITRPGPDRCVVFQEDALFPWLTVEENIAFGLKGQKTDKVSIRDEVRRFLSLVGLSEFRDYLPREISAGMKQRVALARVLIMKPKLLLMDEPFGALDAQTREDMQDLLLFLWEQLSMTIVFVTHDIGEALLLADRILVMDMSPGRIKQEIRLDLARPRSREGNNFLLLSRELHAVLRPGSNFHRGLLRSEIIPHSADSA
jgi:NitT/TauT family transport system ATP-binding protein